MTKPTLFWAACAAVVFALMLISFWTGIHRRNGFYAAWLGFTVCAQLLAACGLALHRPAWFAPAGRVTGAVELLLSICIVILAFCRLDCPINRVLLAGFGAILFFNLLSYVAVSSPLADLRVWGWLRNIGFFGPGVYMLVCFSNLRLDALPLWAGRISDFRFQISDALARVIWS